MKHNYKFPQKMLEEIDDIIRDCDKSNITHKEGISKIMGIVWNADNCDVFERMDGLKNNMIDMKSDI